MPTFRLIRAPAYVYRTYAAASLLRQFAVLEFQPPAPMPPVFTAIADGGAAGMSLEMGAASLRQRLTATFWRNVNYFTFDPARPVQDAFTGRREPI